MLRPYTRSTPVTPLEAEDASSESPNKHEETGRSISLPARPVFSNNVLPAPVPCTGGPGPVSRTSSLPPPAVQAGTAALKYPHVSLPHNIPSYLFSDAIFSPNTKLLAQLMEMGITEMAATKALYWTGNSCIERASNWVFERSEESLKTPLKVEIQMLTTDLEMKEEEMRGRFLSTDSGVCMIDDDEMEGYEAWEMEQMVDMSAECDVYKMVLVINKSHQLSPGQMTMLVGRATGHMLAKVTMLEFGDDQLDMWEACGEQVAVLEGEHTRHLMDLRLAAQCLGLECVEGGHGWDMYNRRYREVAVLGIWGEEDILDKVVGRLQEAV